MTHRLLRLLLGALVVVALAVPARAQRPSSVSISVSTGLPIVGRDTDVTVRFGPPVPETTSLFVRSTGQTAFAEVPATATGEGAFVATVPGTEVTLRGLEVYAQFSTAKGQTFTEPEQRPQETPIRVPSIVLRATSDVVPGARQHRMVSIPLQLLPELGSEFGVTLSGDLPADVFADDYGAEDPSLWRVFRWDPRRDLYADTPSGVGALLPGRGLWIISGVGGAFDIEGGLSTGVAFDGADPFSAPTEVLLEPGWNQIGTPYGYATDWAGVAGSQFTGLPVGHDGAGYQLDQTVLQPWQGYFVENQTNNPVVLRFNPGPEAGGSPETFARTLAAAAGADAHVLRLTAEAGGSVDRETYVGWSRSAARGAFDRRDPPAVAGVDLAVEADDGTAWASRLADGPRAWTLRLAVPEGTRRATLRTEALAGDRPVALFDLDRGTRLALAGSQATVEVAPGETVRRLRLVLDDAGPPPALALSVGPNPVAAGRAVALRAELGAAWATVEVFDALGRRVARVWDAPVAAGLAEWTWAPAAPGLYVARLTADGAVTTRAVTVIR